MTETKRLLKIREDMKRKRPTFKAIESWRYKRVKTHWRKAKGIDSKVRRKKKGIVSMPSIGYRGPKKVRGLHPTGLEEVLVQNLKDLENIKRKMQIIKIASTIGAKKKRKILELAEKKKILVSNPGKITMDESFLFPEPEEELDEEEESEEVESEEEV